MDITGLWLVFLLSNSAIIYLCGVKLDVNVVRHSPAFCNIFTVSHINTLNTIFRNFYSMTLSSRNRPLCSGQWQNCVYLILTNPNSSFDQEFGLPPKFYTNQVCVYQTGQIAAPYAVLNFSVWLHIKLFSKCTMQVVV